MPVEQAIVDVQLESLGNYDSFGTKKEIKYLPEVLHEGETILGLCSGLMDGNTWLCTVTDRRMLLLDKGLVFGLKQMEFPISQIKSVSHSTGLIFGTLLVDTGGQVKKMEHVMKEDAPKIAALLSGLLHDSNKSQENTPIPASGSDAVSQLERLAALKEKGILTEEEFAQQKTKILAG